MEMVDEMSFDSSIDAFDAHGVANATYATERICFKCT